MANADTPRGLVPITNPDGNKIPIEYLKVSSGYSSDIAVGTPVVQLSTGFIVPVTSATPANQLWVGVSMEFYDASEEGTKAIAIATDPFQKFLIQQNGTTGGTQAAVGASGSFEDPEVVYTDTELSSCQMLAGFTTTISTPLRVIGLHPRSTNAWGANNDLIVMPILLSHQRGYSVPV